MEEQLDIITIGESLVELSSDTSLSSSDCFSKYYGGDALVSAVTALRLGAKVGFITRVGNDAFKDFLMDSWQAEGLDISQVKVANEQNGLYFVSKQFECQKEFLYYRKKIAPSRLSIDDVNEDYITHSRIVYASGITQSLSLSAKEAVAKMFKIAKDNGVMTAYDPNYTSAISTPEVARENFNEVAPNLDILFMSTKHDTGSILELCSVENIMKKLWDMGISIIVLKSAEQSGYYVGYNGSINFTEFFTKKDEIVDTTCSGDAFNGAFMYALTHGNNPVEAARLASVTAGLQAKNIGAVKSIPAASEVFAVLKKGES